MQKCGILFRQRTQHLHHLFFQVGQGNGMDEMSISGIKGNADTVLTVKNCAVSGVVTTGIKDIVLEAGGTTAAKR